MPSKADSSRWPKIFGAAFITLAPKVVKSLIDVIARIRPEGVSVLLIEQNVALATEAVDRAYVVKLGRLVSEVGPKERKGALNDEGLAKAYIGG